MDVRSPHRIYFLPAKPRVHVSLNSEKKKNWELLGIGQSSEA